MPLTIVAEGTIPPPDNRIQRFSLSKAPVMYDPALSASYAWSSCSEAVSELSPTSTSLGLASPSKSHIEAPFSLFAAFFSFPFRLSHLSPKALLGIEARVPAR